MSLIETLLQETVTASPAVQQIAKILLVLYLLVMLYIAYLGYKANQSDQNMRTFTLARGYLGPIVLGGAFAATWSSALVFIGIPGWAYTSGLSAMWQAWPFYLAGLVSMIVVAKRFRRIGDAHGSLSLPEWIGDRYGNRYLNIVFAVILLSHTAYIAAQFTGLAIIFESIVGLSYNVGVIGALVIVVLYIVIGGTYSDVVTDFVQAVLMGIIGLSIFGALVAVFGGPFQLASELASVDPNLTAMFSDFPVFSSPVAAAALVFYAFALGFQPQLSNKFLSLRREKDIRLFIISALIFHTLFYLMLWAGPMARILYPNIQPDYAVPAVITGIFPAAVAAIFGMALLSAALSTTDGLLVSVGTGLGNDAYRSFMNEQTPGADVSESVERRSVWIARATIAVVGVVAAWLALQRPSYLATLGAAGIFGFVSAATPSVIFGLFWDGGTDWGSALSAVTAVVVFVSWNYGVWLQGVASILTAGTIATLIGGAVYVVVSLATQSRATDRSPELTGAD